MALLDDIFMDELVDDPDPILEEPLVDEDNDDGNEQPPPNDSAPSADAVRVEPPKKKVIRNPQPKLNPQRLTGPRGIQCIEQYFKNVKFKGKGHELADLNTIMSNLEHWANRLYPRGNFDDVLKKLEVLGHKRPVMVHVKKIRLGMIEELGQDSNLVLSDTETPDQPRTSDDIFNELLGTQPTRPAPPVKQITEAQRERMLRNRQLAEEKRLARLAAMAEKAATLESIQFQNALIATEGATRETILVSGEVGQLQVESMQVSQTAEESGNSVDLSQSRTESDNTAEVNVASGNILEVSQPLEVSGNTAEASQTRIQSDNAGENGQIPVTAKSVSSDNSGSAESRGSDVLNGEVTKESIVKCSNDGELGGVAKKRKLEESESRGKEVPEIPKDVEEFLCSQNWDEMDV